MADNNKYQSVWGGNEKLCSTFVSRDAKKYVDKFFTDKLNENSAVKDELKNPTNIDIIIKDVDKNKFIVYKTDCADRLTCYYKNNGAVKLLHSTEGVWNKELDIDESGNTMFSVFADYNRWENSNSKDYRIIPNDNKKWFTFDSSSGKKKCKYSFVSGSSYSTGANRFQSCVDLLEVEFPGSFSAISESTFMGCTSLSSYTPTRFITSIGEKAFSGCTSLAEIKLGRNLYDDDGNNALGNHSFENCTSARDIVFDEFNGVYQDQDSMSGGCITEIPDYCFKNCTSLRSTKYTSYMMPNMGLLSDVLFDNKIVLPYNIKSIGKYAFESCSSLTNVTIPNSVTSIGESAFDNCISLTSINIPSGVTSISDYTFRYCTAMTACTIGNDSLLTIIGLQAFYDCSNLTSINIPSGVTSIGESAFYNCSNLTSINIPSGVTSIGGGAFQNCTSLISVTVKAENPPTLGADAFDSTHSDLVIYVPSESVETYKLALGWSSYANKIQEIQ